MSFASFSSLFHFPPFFRIKSLHSGQYHFPWAHSFLTFLFVLFRLIQSVGSLVCVSVCVCARARPHTRSHLVMEFRLKLQPFYSITVKGEIIIPVYVQARSWNGQFNVDSYRRSNAAAVFTATKALTIITEQKPTTTAFIMEGSLNEVVRSLNAYWIFKCCFVTR